MRQLSRVLGVVVPISTLVLIGCGGGGGGGNTETTMRPPPQNPPPVQQPDPDPPPAPPTPRPVERLAYPYAPSGVYSITGLPTLAARDARQMPVYQDRNRLMVGVDQGASYFDTFMVGNSIARIEHGLAGALPVAGQRGDVAVRHGRIPDGVGDNVVSAYLAEAIAGTAQRYASAPQLRVIGPASADDIDRTIRAVQLVNAALPDAFKVQVLAPAPGASLRDRVGTDGTSFRGPDEARNNAIDVEFVPAGEYRRPAGSAAATWGWPLGHYAYIQFNMGANSYPRDHEMVTLLVHELAHALGIDRHVSARFASIMEATHAMHQAEQNGVPKPLSVLFPVDREALRALYGRLDVGDSPEDFGPWEARTWRIDGNGPHANFGVALRNGYAEPWAYGLRPTTTLANNRRLSGSATWSGTLLGLTPSTEAVAGDAAIGVSLATMRGTADFTALERWAPRAAPGAAGTGTRWGDGDLRYTISVAGNTFRQTGGDAGTLTGIFTGRSHEGAAGTLERSDLEAAFGASR